MARRYIAEDPISRLAIWARRMALFSLLAALLSVVIVRSGLLEIGPALAVITKRRWLVVDQRPPQPLRREGRIEAVARTPIMGFRDDVVVRIRPNEDGSRIDMRSSSRYGSFDFGANASRVRVLMNEIEDAIRAQRPERPPAQPSAKKSTPGKKDQSKK